jgi:hypothetical protein
MSNEIPFDFNVIITTSISYSTFVIRDIKIKLGEPALVEIMMFQTKPVTQPLYETISIPVDVYTNWKYDEDTIKDFVKNYIQETMHDWNGGS